MLTTLAFIATFGVAGWVGFALGRQIERTRPASQGGPHTNQEVPQTTSNSGTKYNPDQDLDLI